MVVVQLPSACATADIVGIDGVVVASAAPNLLCAPERRRRMHCSSTPIATYA